MRRSRQAGRAGVIFVIVALVVVLLGGGGGVYLYGRSQLAAPASTSSGTVRLRIAPGEPLERVVRDLSDQGLITSSFWFGWYAKLKGLGSHLVAGTFTLSRSMSAATIVSTLESPPVVPGVRVTFAEGLTAAQMAEQVARSGLGITAAQYLNEVKHGTFTQPFLAGRPAGASLEGFLFPDTYRIPIGTDAHGVVELQLADFATRAMPLLGGLSPDRIYATVTVASIIEREARAASDRPLVASVIDNRLAAHMRLQVDASLLYGLGLNGGELTQEQFKVDTPYNTYLHDGLPPTPIANPGASSITAAVHPATTDYLFYVSDSCGHNHFAVTPAQHEQNIRKYIGTGVC